MTSAIIRQRRDTAANWASVNPTPQAGVLCFETDTRLAKLGDGTTAWNSLPYIGTRTSCDEDFISAVHTEFVSYFVPGAKTRVALSTFAMTANQLYAVPFRTAARGPTLGEVKLRVTTGVAATNVRFGLYANLSESHEYPGALISDIGSGSSATSSSTITLTPTLVLPKGALIWACFLSDGAPTLTGVSANAGGTMLGYPNETGTAGNAVIWASQTYGALPSTFPATCTAQTGTHPACFLKFTA